MAGTPSASAHVIGNVALDWSFETDRLPLDGESVIGRQRSVELGGKGANQAVVLARCGVRVSLTARLGDDEGAGRIRAALAGEPLDTTLIAAGTPSDRSMIWTDASARNAILTTVDCARGLTEGEAETALAGAGPGDWLVLQGNLRATVTGAAMRRARARGLRVAFNPSPWSPALAPQLGEGATVFVNEAEAEAATGLRGEAAAAEIVRRGAGAAVLTLGARGALLRTAEASAEVPAAPADAADPTGAGDTFLAVALACAMRRGDGIAPDDLARAARAAALAVSRPGTHGALPTVAELRTILGMSGREDVNR
jgi:ribokinase